MTTLIFTPLLVLSGLLFARKVASSFAELIAVTSIFIFSCIIASGNLLGFSGLLTQPYWMILAVIFGFTGVAFVSKSKQTVVLPSLRYPGHIICALTVLVLIPLSASVFAIIVSQPANIDDLLYHFPKLFVLAQQASFLPSGLELVDSYPQNSEMLGAFLTLASSDYLFADGCQLLAFPLFLASLFMLGQSQKLKTETSLLVMLLACFIPSIWSLAITFHVDLFSAVMLISALALLSRRTINNRCSYFFLIGCAFGLLMGTKFIALPWAVILLIALCVSPNRPRSLAEVSLVLAPLIILGGQSYFLNMLRHSNPLYPYSFDFLGFKHQGTNYKLDTIWSEEKSAGYSGLEKILMSWFSINAISQSNHEHWFGGLGALWPIFFLSSLAALYQNIKQKDYSFTWLFFLSSLLFLSTPVNYTARFTLFICGIGAIGFGKFFDSLSGRYGETFKSILLSIVFVAALHCVRQNLSLLAHQVGPKRSATVLEICQREARPAEIRELSGASRSIFDGAKEIFIVHGSAPADRLLSYACFWQLAPEAKIRFFELAESQRLAREMAATTTRTVVILSSIDSSAPLPELAYLRRVYSGLKIAVFEKTVDIASK